MITISEDKISAKQSLKPNDSTEDLSTSNVTLTLLGNTRKDSTHSFVLDDPFVDEITFNIKITQWKNLNVNEEFTTQTFKWKDLQESVTLYGNNGYELSATCRIVTGQLKITYSIIADLANMDSLTFKFESKATIRGAKMVDDFTFQDGTMKISSIIDYQQKIELGSNKSFTLTYNCLGLKRTGTGAYGGYSWVNTMEMYTKGTSIKAEANQKIEFYIYLIFKNPEE